MKRLSRYNFVVSVFVLVAAASVAQADHPERQVTFLLRNDAAVLPDMSVSAPLESIQVNLSPLQAALAQHNVVLMGKLFPDFNLEDTTAIAWSGETVRLTDYSRFWFAEVSDSVEVQPLFDALLPLAGVSLVAKRLPFGQAPLSIPNDPRFPEQYYLKHPNPAISHADINWLPAWEISTGGNTKVGVYGGSISLTHPELAGRVSEIGHRDHSDHETTIACIIAAATNSNPAAGMAGINGQARIYSAGLNTTDDEDQFVDFMREMRKAGCKIVNYSYKWLFEPSEQNADISAPFAIRDLYMSNVLFVAAAGNYVNGDAGLPYYPARSKWAVAVGATNYNGIYWISSAQGPQIEAVAPGELILSCHTDGSYNEQNGTSFAAPMYAGTASLLMAIEPTLTADDAKKLIRSTAYDKGSAGKDDLYGYGLIDAGTAASRLVAPYQLSHLSTTGGSSYTHVNCNGQLFYDVSGMDPFDVYYGDRHEVRKAVTFPTPYETAPLVWGRTVGTVGWDAANPNYGEGYCEVVPNSITTTGCILKTYVYDLVQPQDGWFPASPASVQLKYTVNGIPDIAPYSVDVTNPWGNGQQTQTFNAGSAMQVNWTVSDNHLEATRSILYLIRETGTGSVVTQIISNRTVSQNGNGVYVWSIPASTAGGTTYKIRVTTDGISDLSEGYFTINAYQGKGGGEDPLPDPCDGVCPMPLRDVPSVTDFLPFGPNPFRTETRIRFSLDGTHSVSLKVYDVQGRLVNTLFTGTRSRGAYEKQWTGVDRNGQALPSGVYFVVMNADRRQLTKKVVIIR
jgi:hypothetical protein